VSSALLLAASAIFLIAFVMYNRGILRGKNTPAFAAWSVFSLITLVNCVTYLQFTKSWVNVAVLFTDFVICAGTTLIVLVHLRGKVCVDQTDKAIVLVSLSAVLLWTVFNTAIGGNLLNQVAYTLTFIPTYRNVLRNPNDEPTLPWALWTMAFVLNIIALALQPQAQPIDYVSPVVCLMHHVAITLLSRRRR